MYLKFELPILKTDKAMNFPVQKLPNLFPSSDPGPIGFSMDFPHVAAGGHMVWPGLEPRRIIIDKIIFKFCIVVVIL